MRTRTSLLLAGSFLVASPAASQSILTLEQAFVPDPQIVAVRAGGDVEVDFDGCDYGYVAETAAVGIDFVTSGVSDLYFYAESDGDTMLLIETPSRRILCDDDGYGNLNPLVHVPDAEEGTYLVFVGSYSEGDYQDATLYISELDPGSGAMTPSFLLDPLFGDVDLSEKFTGEQSLSVTAGGDIDVNVDSCGFGYVSDAPSVDLRYTTSGATDLYVYARGSEDTTLLINLPNGDWVCDDDGLGDSNPLVRIPRAADGLYNIWVGTFGGESAQASLHISEVDPR